MVLNTVWENQINSEKAIVIQNIGKVIVKVEWELRKEEKESRRKV